MQMRVLPRSRVLAALVFAALPAGAQVTPYGSGINPPGSLAVLSGTPQVGGSFVLGVKNTAIGDAPLGLALLSIATAPAPGFPSGLTIPGLGMSGPGAPGELLLSAAAPNPLVTLGPVFWFGGADAAAAFPLSIPAQVALSGLTFYAQGGLLTPSLGYSIGLTNGLKVSLVAPDFPGLVLIQPGTFQMGSAAPGGEPYFGNSSTQPVHQVTLSEPFWMGRYEVTQAEYEGLMGVNPSEFLGTDRPVERVTWNAAVAYCNALNVQQIALGMVPAGYQYRLPTEAEWEYACRGGTTTEYHYGPELFCNQARFSFSYHTIPPAECDAPGGTAPVGSYSPNAWGLYDMHGNVWEWCLDSYGSYTATAKTDPYVSVGSQRVLRGGWYGGSYGCRSAYRNFNNPGDTFSTFTSGFRVVLAPIIVP